MPSPRTHTDKLDHLKECFLFQNFPPEDLRKLSFFTRETVLKKGELLFSEGMRADVLFYLIEGEVQVYKVTPEGREATLHIFRPGELMAEAVLFLERVYPANGKAASRAKVLMVEGRPLLQLMEENPALARLMLASMAMKLQEFTFRFEALSSTTIETRLARYLLGPLAGNKPQEGRSCALRLSKKALAAELGSTPESLSRALRHLIEKELISVSGKQITLKDVGGLREMAEMSRG